MIDEIAEAWGWKGVQPQAFVAQNEFGNVIFTDINGRYWRLCPEELSCDIIAADRVEFTRFRATEDFLTDWMMKPLVEQARSKLGVPASDRCFCLKIPAVLGGAYAIDNVGTITRVELIAFSGDIAKQIDGLPDGARIKLTVTD
jgi:hypothetical protein